MWRRASVLTYILVIPPAGLAAQGQAGSQETEPEPFAEAKAGKSLDAYRIRGTAPLIDGRLDDDVWELADSIDDLVQWEPENMARPSERTVVQIAFDTRYLYVAVRCLDSTPDGVVAGLGRRDDFPSSDQISIGFDPRHDHQTAYIFQTNPSGVQGDMRRFDDTRIDRDYNAVWEVVVRMTPEGWIAEFRIPFSQMRFSVPAGSEAVWGFNVRRTIQRKGEEGQWVGRPRGEQGNVSRWGHLVFEDQALAPPQRLEILPYVLAGRTELAGSDNADHIGALGTDLRLGLGSAATLSATVNPDFAQVEQDPAVLNLTVFETFFPERRPFFLEDARTFIPAVEAFRLFHSRRIGRRPDHFDLEPGDVLVDRPAETTILGATKLTGKRGAWTYGGLNAVTAAEYATVEAEGGRAERLIEPLTSYSVGRLQRDVGTGSNVGGLATVVNRSGAADAFAAGFDHTLRWNRNRWQWNGSYAVTYAPGDEGVRTGYGVVSNLGFQAKHFGMTAFNSRIGPDFRVNDVGFLRRRVDFQQVGVGVNGRQPDPWGIFRSVQVFGNIGRVWNTAGLRLGRFYNGGVNAQFRNFWRLTAFGGGNAEREDDLDTRGGPPILRPAIKFVNVFLNSDSRKTWRIGFSGNGAQSRDGSWNARLGPSITVQPSPRLQVSFSSNYTRADEMAQWIENIDVTGDGQVDHVYGRLRRDVLDVTLRSTFAVHRDMTLQLFLQPFVAVGDYTDIKRLARPRSYDFEPATLPDNPDFNTKSLRGNVVLRWEYIRGSTLFFVWNVSAVDTSRPGVFSPVDDFRDAFGADGTHSFMVKASYWWSR